MVCLWLGHETRFGLVWCTLHKTLKSLIILHSCIWNGANCLFLEPVYAVIYTDFIKGTKQNYNLFWHGWRLQLNSRRNKVGTLPPILDCFFPTNLFWSSGMKDLKQWILAECIITFPCLRKDREELPICIRQLAGNCLQLSRTLFWPLSLG